MIPPRYTLFPSVVLRMREVPIHLRWTYLVLYALAWTHQYHYVNETYQQLADILSDLEGQEISPRGVRQRLTDLAEHGLVERRRVGGRYRTYLLVRHDQIAESGAGDARNVTRGGLGDAPSVTYRGSGDALERHPNYINADDADIDPGSDQDQQQHHHYSNRGDVELFEQNLELLEMLGIDEPVAKRLAREEHVTPAYLQAWLEHQVREAAEGNVLGPGFFVIRIGQGEEPPGDWRQALEERKDAWERERYIRGKYADYIRH